MFFRRRREDSAQRSKAREVANQIKVILRRELKLLVQMDERRNRYIYSLSEPAYRDDLVLPEGANRGSDCQDCVNRGVVVCVVEFRNAEHVVITPTGPRVDIIVRENVSLFDQYGYAADYRRAVGVKG